MVALENSDEFMRDQALYCLQLKKIKGENHYRYTKLIKEFTQSCETILFIETAIQKHKNSYNKSQSVNMKMYVTDYSSILFIYSVNNTVTDVKLLRINFIIPNDYLEIIKTISQKTKLGENIISLLINMKKQKTKQNTNLENDYHLLKEKYDKHMRIHKNIIETQIDEIIELEKQNVEKSIKETVVNVDEERYDGDYLVV